MIFKADNKNTGEPLNLSSVSPIKQREPAEVNGGDLHSKYYLD